MGVIEIRDAATGSSARILPDLGFNCFQFQAVVGHKLVEVLDALPGFESGTIKASSSGIPLLFPFPNRIRKGQFNWRGESYSLPGTDKWQNAIHGLCFDRPWRVTAKGEDFVTGEFQLSVDAPDRVGYWPADFILEVDYELIGPRLRANFRITNPGDRDLPWGLGTHPYFKLPLAGGRVEDCTVDAPARKLWELVDCLPTGQTITPPDDKELFDGAYVTALKLDDVYTDLDYDGPQFDLLVIDEASGIQITQTCPPIFREVVAFTPPNRGAVCLEPYTCVTDAINLAAQGIDSGLRVLAPGTEFHTWIDIAVSPILA
jgi:aldose 1-epimerase